MTVKDVKKEFQDSYKEWLLERVGFEKTNYKKLMTKLQDSHFIYYIDRDQNRAEDGKNLRDNYLSEKKLPIYLFDYEPCSVLEMLVALSIRIDNEWIGDPAEEHPEEIFWEMLCNLGLDKRSDRRMNYDFLEEILHVWIRREFDRDGKGSIFPLKHTRRDQRKLEIWVQMQEYLSENY